jgi:hypothetical protein
MLAHQPQTYKTDTMHLFPLPLESFSVGKDGYTESRVKPIRMTKPCVTSYVYPVSILKTDLHCRSHRLCLTPLQDKERST